MSTFGAVIAVILAGIIGTAANALAVSFLFGAPLMPLILSPGRNAVAILVAVLLIPIFARMGSASAWITSLILLTVIPSILAKMVFAAQAPWGAVLGVNAVYALTATIIFVAIRKG